MSRYATEESKFERFDRFLGASGLQASTVHLQNSNIMKYEYLTKNILLILKASIAHTLKYVYYFSDKFLLH